MFRNRPLECLRQATRWQEKLVRGRLGIRLHAHMEDDNMPSDAVHSACSLRRAPHTVLPVPQILFFPVFLPRPAGRRALFPRSRAAAGTAKSLNCHDLANQSHAIPRTRCVNGKPRPLAAGSCRAQSLAVYDSAWLQRAIQVWAFALGAGGECALKKLTAAA